MVYKLHRAKKYEHVIAAIEAALVSGQSQPWMYEVLALSMEVAGRSKEDVERVVLSGVDFAGADFQSMMFSGLCQDEDVAVVTACRAISRP